MSEFNAAFSYNFENAVTGKTPDYVIDYENALVSRGELPNATKPGCTVTGSELFFTWTDNSGVGSALPTDQAVLVAFCPNLNLTIFNTNAGVRSDASASLNVGSFSGETIETWIAFITKGGVEASDSLFTGELVVS